MIEVFFVDFFRNALCDKGRFLFALGFEGGEKFDV